MLNSKPNWQERIKIVNTAIKDFEQGFLIIDTKNDLLIDNIQMSALFRVSSSSALFKEEIQKPILDYIWCQETFNGKKPFLWS